MKFNEFLEGVYVTTNVSMQQNYTPYKQAETQAAHALISGQRRILRICAYVKLLGEYLLVQLRILKRETGPEAQARIKAQFVAEAAVTQAKISPPIKAAEDPNAS